MKPAPVPSRPITPLTIGLGLLIGIAAVFAIQRFVFGLGATTNLNDGYTWGIWIAFDVVVGTAFACGGYALAIVVYIFNKGEYHPLVRPALLASALGYTLGGASVIFDLGRWWNVWHIFWPGYAQPNSVMFEVAVCISLYIIVLWIEFAPAYLDYFGLKSLRQSLKPWLFAFIALGVVLPSMHQSSLGSMMAIFGHLVHPLWQTVLLPLLFLISAIGMGFSIVIFESSLAMAGYDRPHETSILAKVSILAALLNGVYIILRLADIVIQGKFSFAFDGSGLSFLFWVEIFLYAVPIILLSNAKMRGNQQLLFVAAVAMLAGGSIYRIDTYLVAFNPGGVWHYFPSLQEIMITIGIVSAEILGYMLLTRKLAVLPAVALSSNH